MSILSYTFNYETWWCYSFLFQLSGESFTLWSCKKLTALCRVKIYIYFSHVFIIFLFTFLLVTFILVCCSQRWDNILRCNLLFGFIGHFGLLKDVNIYIISLSLSNTHTHSLLKFLNIESRYSLSHVHVKCNIFGLIGHIWPPKTRIESICLSTLPARPLLLRSD